MDGMFANKTVLVTGATGSFGNTIVPELLSRGVSRVIAFSRDEEKQWRMRRKFTDTRLQFAVGDVRDADRIREVMPGVDIVFHAAALKFVPTCEDWPMEGVKTNMLGSLNVKQACAACGVQKAMLVSTDKAVKPVNAYGMSKAMAEKIWLNDPIGETVFSAVRYGNVLGSRGSVIPLFKELMAEGKPLPITDFAMSRFFLTLKQAIALVMYGAENMAGGEIFIPNNPACLITDLAIAMAGEEYPREEIGIRPGEKLAEILISEDEARHTEARGELFVIHRVGTEAPGIAEEFSSTNARQLDVPALKALLVEAGL
jgi:UDP-N-acetylglucosamine 4,6-dehydratase/5-epimerase